MSPPDGSSPLSLIGVGLQTVWLAWFLRPSATPVPEVHRHELLEGRDCESELRLIIQLQSELSWWKLLALLALAVIGIVMVLGVAAGFIACRCVRCLWCCRRDSSEGERTPSLKAVKTEPDAPVPHNPLIVTPSSRRQHNEPRHT
jgi:hypothetical protein